MNRSVSYGLRGAASIVTSYQFGMSWKGGNGWGPQHKMSSVVTPAGSPVLGNGSSLLGVFPQKAFPGASAPVATSPRAALCHQTPDRGCWYVPGRCDFSRRQHTSAQLFGTAPAPAGGLSLSPLHPAVPSPAL